MKKGMPSQTLVAAMKGAFWSENSLMDTAGLNKAD